MYDFFIKRENLNQEEQDLLDAIISRDKACEKHVGKIVELKASPGIYFRISRILLSDYGIPYFKLEMSKSLNGYGDGKVDWLKMQVKDFQTQGPNVIFEGQLNFIDEEKIAALKAQSV